MKDTYSDSIDVLTFGLGQSHALEKETILRVHPALATDCDCNMKGQGNTVSLYFFFCTLTGLKADAKGKPTKDFNGLSGCENTKDGLYRVTQWSISLELVTDWSGIQIFDLEL